MPRLPQVNAKELVGALKQAGFEEYDQTGSHLRLVNEESNVKISVPIHAGDMGRGLLKKILKQASISEGEFRKFL